MITGLYVKLTSTELSEILAKRIEHHRKKGEQYSKQMLVLADGDDEDTAVSKFANSNSSNNPYMSLRESKRAHEKKVAYFTFFKDHLVAEDYLLSQSDLQNLEIVQY
jgi:acyl-CoA hydrolase